MVLQNHFSSLDGLETTNAGGDPHIGTPIIPTAIVEFNYEHITVENRVVSNFWADLNEMEEHASDTRKEVVYTNTGATRFKEGDYFHCKMMAF